MIYRIILVFVLGITLCSLVACSEKSSNVETKVALKTQLDSVAYAIGMNIGNTFKPDSIFLNPSILSAGLNDILNDNELLMSEKDIQQVMMAFQMDMQKKQQDRAMKEVIVNKEIGEKFLADNKSKEGVITTASGLQYIVMKEGTGASPLATDKVKVHYHGTLLDGTVFDSSVDRGEPIEFPLNGVIKGWTEGVQLMKVGSKFRFFIPSELAYGDRGSPPKIGPGSTLIFEVELLDIVK